MKLFLDTANLDHIREVSALGILDGVTTNPSLMAKEGIAGGERILQHYVDICQTVKGDVSAEVISTDFDGIVAEAKILAPLHKHIVVKVPMIKEGIRAIRYLSSNGIRINCTLVFSSGQALVAAKAGASYVSPFIGRLDDVATDGLELIAQMRQIFDNYNIPTKILAASIRHPMHIVRCAEIGADVATCPYKVLMSLFNHPLTESGLEKFMADHKRANKVSA